MSNKRDIKNLDAIKQELLRRKEELEQKLVELNMQEPPDQIMDIGDQAQSVSQETLRRSLQDTEGEEYKRILKALEMLQEGVYGICVDCGQPISEKRLKLFPNATRCLSCQEKLEES